MEEEKIFTLHSNFKPTGDQPEAIDYLVKGALFKAIQSELKSTKKTKKTKIQNKN